MINSPGPYSYDGRDAGRRAGITQPQRSLVTYSLSWVSAVVADVPSQLYFRRCYAGNASGPGSELMQRVGRFAELTSTLSLQTID